MTSPEFTPNPLAKENSTNIQKAWGEMVRTGVVERGNGYMPLGVKRDIALHYDFKLTEIPLVLTEIRNLGAQYAYRDYRFYRDSHTPDTLVVRSDSKTRAEHESQGFGSGLILITNDVIGEVIKNNKAFAGLNVIAGILDTAKGRGIDDHGNLNSRKNWTSYFAKKLGYDFSQATRMWYKVYQGHIDADDLLRMERFNA